jgi:hypothetical protein
MDAEGVLPRFSSGNFPQAAIGEATHDFVLKVRFVDSSLLMFLIDLEG